ncbi:hypothetical protein H4R34_006207, partial [Dimargaris verticillata]
TAVTAIVKMKPKQVMVKALSLTKPQSRRNANHIRRMKLAKTIWPRARRTRLGHSSVLGAKRQRRCQQSCLPRSLPNSALTLS